MIPARELVAVIQKDALAEYAHVSADDQVVERQERIVRRRFDVVKIVEVSGNALPRKEARFMACR